MHNNENYILAEIAKILVGSLKINKEFLITYGDLARQLPFDINPRNLDHPLGRLSDLCKENGMPLISSIVVNNDSYRPGAGYFKYYFPGSPEREWDDIFVEQLNKIKNYKGWESLLTLI